jgi:uncharacterized membrane protein
MATFAQWVHVTAAVLGMGGIGFLLVILIPATRVLSPEQREVLLKAVLGKFRWVSWAVIILLLASGLYNVRLAWEVPWGTYWKFLTIKIILALLVFAISLCLTVPLKFLAWFRARRDLWLSVAFGLGIATLLISAYLRRG